MADFPIVPICTDAYLADTRHLSAMEHGAYFLMLQIAWRSPNNGIKSDIIDNDARAARALALSVRQWRSVKSTVLQFWVLDSGVYRQKKLDEMRVAVTNRSIKAKRAAEHRWHDKSLELLDVDDASACEEHMLDDCQPKPKPKPKKINKEFDDYFWPNYPELGIGVGGKKRANPKEPARLKYIALRKSGYGFDDIIDGLKAYEFSDPDFIPQAKTWLHQKRFLDVVPKKVMSYEEIRNRIFCTAKRIALQKKQNFQNMSIDRLIDNVVDDLKMFYTDIPEQDVRHFIKEFINDNK